VLIRDPQEDFTPQAWLSTTLAHTPEQRLPWCVRRWSREGTCEEARTPLGRGTPRQGHERALARTTPALLSRYAVIARTAHVLSEKGLTGVRSTAWSRKTRPPFSDAMALVRRQWWNHLHFSMSQQEAAMIKIPHELFERLIDAVCYAASLDKVELRYGQRRGK
jgi:hypothetical protein